MEVRSAESGTGGRRPRAPRAGPFEAVVYVHGMGSQRRYEETSRLIDRLDDYVNGRQGGAGAVGMLSAIEARVEPLLPERTGAIGYIETRYSDGTNKPPTRVRFYEAYWAPVMARTSSAASVARWLFRQPLRPWKTMTAPWRERQRLRRATLVSQFERRRPGTTDITRAEYAALLELYDEFEGPAQRRAHDKGSFAQFLDLIEARTNNPAETARLVDLAKAWRRAYWLEELRNVFVLATMALALVLLGGALVLSVLAILTTALDLETLTGVLSASGAPFKADLPTALGVAGSILGLIGFTGFLTQYLGDVEAWATYEETEAKHVARATTLNEAITVLSHVLGPDSACTRVTVVAHSLGCSVAHDALLALARRNRAHAGDPARTVRFEKLQHFVTMGSPIDKIEYFFESYSSRSHRYKRVVENLRGDIGSAPFCDDDGAPHIHWVNYWDEGDVISGALHSPACARPGRARIDNVQVASFHFPAPGASHSAYFDHERVIGDMFEMIYRRKHAFDPAPGAATPDDYERLDFGPGETPVPRGWWQALGLLTPWLSLAGVAAWVLPRVLAAPCPWGRLCGAALEQADLEAWLKPAALLLWSSAAAIALFLFVAWMFSKLAGHRKPIPDNR